MIHTGDCVEVMAGMEPESFDAIVTDPPAGIGFMGKSWDHHRGGRDEWVAWMTVVMRECYRVLKPGHWIVVWSLPRTSHWTAWAIEDAGFRVTDVLMHVFASGFPKGRGQLKPAYEPWILAKKPGPMVHLQIDATRIASEPIEPFGSPAKSRGGFLNGTGEPRRQFEQNAAGRWPPNILLSDPELFDQRNDGVVGSGAVSGGGEFAQSGFRVGGDGDGVTLGLAGRKDAPDNYGDTGGYSRFFLIPKSSRSDREPPLADYSLELHRKSGECDKLRAWGNEVRSQPEQTVSTSPGRAISEGTGTGSSPSDTLPPGKPSTGRSRPDTRSTTSTATSRTTGSPISSSSIPSLTSGSTPVANSEMGSGGSRAPFVENSSLWTESIGTYPERDGRTTDGADPAGSGRWSSRNRCGDCGKPLPRFSTHPTQKPTDLMRHLVRLVCPPGGVILDPFAGSGTTGVAATLEGFGFVLIEREPEYVAIAQARLNGVQQGLGLDVPAPTSSYRPPAKMPPIKHDKTTQAIWESYTGKPEDDAA